MKEKQELIKAACDAPLQRDVVLLGSHFGSCLDLENAATFCTRACWGILRPERGAPARTNAERSKSTAIIIRAAVPWTLMAVPVLLPRHIRRALLRLEGAST